MEPKSSTTADHFAIDIEPEPQTHTDVFEMDCSKYPYYARLKQFRQSKQFRSLQFLAQWMEVGRDPVFRDSVERFKDEREERWKRTSVKLVELKRTTPSITTFKDIENLKETLQVMPATTVQPSPFTETSVRVLIVEDLSRDIIELLCSQLKINPSFFAAHIGNRGSYAVSGNKGLNSVPNERPQQ